MPAHSIAGHCLNTGENGITLHKFDRDPVRCEKWIARVQRTRAPGFQITGCRIDNCESCFSKEFCTKCKSGFYLHKGRCFDTCPEGFAPLEDAMECGDGCEVGPWSEWGACTRRNKTCGHKWGLETRTRHIIKKPPKDTIPCPTIAESRRCKMAMRHCRRGGSGKHRSTEPKKKNKKKLRIWAQDQHSDHLASACSTQ